MGDDRDGAVRNPYCGGWARCVATALITSDITSAASRALLIGRIGKAQQIVDDYSCLMGADEVGTLRGLTERRTILDKLIGDYRAV